MKRLFILLLLALAGCKKEPVGEWPYNTRVVPKDGNPGNYTMPFRVIDVAGQGEGWIVYNLKDSSFPQRKSTAYGNDLKKVIK
jgi:hypothetical protein